MGAGRAGGCTTRSTIKLCVAFGRFWRASRQGKGIASVTKIRWVRIAVNERKNCSFPSDNGCGQGSIIQNVKKYCGKTLQSAADLQSKACCCWPSSISKKVQEAMTLVADEVVARYYGCGSPLPPLLDKMTLLDLGCGSGLDVYVAAKLVGEHGRVTGVDMTQQQLDVAEKYEEEQRRRLGYIKIQPALYQGLYRGSALCGGGRQLRGCRHLQLRYQPLARQGKDV
jgi:hypothetical protein